ncbi:DUF4129 domain-containing protein [Demequina sp. SYSU T00192]|uniref:DUF4129 domain-containing protein n=1 Tax=Demequina litoralis TaxID=3051660 RepID=A0ABT8G6Y3_9MICO|nr:DUF4129 domain-containing protein [Demequina sp. SYSU T00192]MDN4474902.1 DUF4129 domain-containing protein [Demequina sp. SYSU T00192]
MSLDAPPLTPDAETARRWAVEELAKDEYRDGGTSWLERVLRWFSDLLEGLGDGVSGAAGPTGTVIAVAVGLALVALVLWLVVGPMRRNRRAAAEEGLFADERGAAALAEAARAAASSGDWESATLDLYRALVRDLAERDVIVLTPGLTAAEAAERAAAVLPALASRLRTDADAFDGIRYGHVPATEATYAHVLETMRACAGARPRLAAAEAP